MKQTTRVIVVVLSVLVYLTILQSTPPNSIPLSIVKDALAQENNSTLDSSQEQRSNNSLLNVLNQSLNEPENVNATSRDNRVYNQTSGTSDNETKLATNGINNTSSNGTDTEILTNASQQPQGPLQPLLGLLPTPSQSQQQQPPSTSQQQPPSPPPVNLIPRSSLPLQQPPPLLPPIQPLQQQPPPIMQPLQQPSTMLPPPSTILPPPPSTPLYPVPTFPQTGSSYSPPVILSQYSYVDNIGTMHIVGEVLNQAPVTARFVEIIATFYNAYGQVIGTDFTYADPSDLAPGQRAPFDILVLEGSVPIYQMSRYGLAVDWQ